MNLRFVIPALASLVCVPAFAANLSDKLSAQWSRYENAQKRLLESSPTPITRTEWEKLIAPPEDLAWTPEDLQNLIEDQKARISSARERALKASLFDLGRLRLLPSEKAQKEIARFCSEIPKGGMLHIHPTGTLKRDTIEKLLHQENPKYPIAQLIEKNHSSLYPNELRFLKTLGSEATFSSLPVATQEKLIDFDFLPPGSHPFTRFDATFSFLHYAVQKDDDYYTVFDDFSRRAAAEGVSYVEFTWGIDPQDAPMVEALSKRIEANTGIVARFNRSFYRLQPQADLLKQAQDLLAVHSSAIVGIDLLGNETSTPALETGQAEYATILRAVREGKSSLHRTMHAGELGDPRDPRDAMLLSAERLGHGVQLIEDPVALEYAATRKIAVEVNLVSNIRLQAIDSLKHHPYLKYLRLGIPVSLSTDDEGILDTEINKECQVAIAETDVTYFELRQMAFNSIETSFADEATKERLLGKLKESFSRFEKTFKFAE